MALPNSLKLLRTINSSLIYDPMMFFVSKLYPTSAKFIGKPLEPYLHQIDLFSRLILRRPIRVLIADEIGLGKTVEAIALIRYLESRGEVSKILILTPKILIDQWREELKRAGIGHWNIKVLNRDEIKVLGTARVEHKYYILSIDLAKRREHREFIKHVNWDAIVVDEVHNAGYGTQRWWLIKDLVTREQGKHRHVIFLSATPHRGNVLDYLYRLYLLDPDLSEEKIRRRGLDNRSFYRLTHGSILFRRTKELVNEVENRKVFTNCNFCTVAVQPTSEEMEFSHQLVSFLKEKISLTYEEEPSPAALLAVLVRKRASSSPAAAIKTFTHILEGLSKRYIAEELPKDMLEDAESILGLDFGDLSDIDKEDIDEVVEDLVQKCSGILDKSDELTIKNLIELASKIKENDSKLKTVVTLVNKYLRSGNKVIIFTEYKDTLNYLKENFINMTPYYGRDFFETISGETKDRFDEIKEKFESNKCNLLIATDVASEGLNLQVANIVINYEAPWSPLKLEQRMGRVWRLGQKNDVHIYTAFMATPDDVDVMRNLYVKLLSMKEALDDVRPLLGEKVQIAYRVTATASEGLWKVRGVEFAEVELNGKKEKVNEFKLILASLKGKLSDYVELLLSMLAKVNEELAQKAVFPFVDPRDIRDNMINRISTTSAKDYEKVLRDLCSTLCDILNVDSRKKSICTHQNLNKIWMLIQDLLTKDESTIAIPPVYFSSAVAPSNVVHLFKVEVMQDNNTIYEELMAYDVKFKKILYGVKLLEFLTRVVKSSLLELNTDTDEKQFVSELALGAKVGIERKCKERYEAGIARYIDYLQKTERAGYRSETKLPAYKVNIQKITTLWGIKVEKEDVPDEIKRRIEEAAMKLVMDIERKEGRKPDDSPARRGEHYDIFSYDPSTGEERYIEVKGHAGVSIYAELTPSEYQFGKEKKEKYWLYIVFNLTTAGDVTSARWLRFKDATNTMKVSVTGETRYILEP